MTFNDFNVTLMTLMFDGDVWEVFMKLLSFDLSFYRSITDQSCLKVYHKDPAQAFNHGDRPSNGDARVSASPG